LDLLCAEFVATLSSASREDVLTIGGLHADTKTVGFAPFAVIWLKSSLHIAAFIRLGMNFGLYPMKSGEVRLLL
jgi:hypothetical protein